MVRAAAVRQRAYSASACLRPLGKPLPTPEPGDSEIGVRSLEQAVERPRVVAPGSVVARAFIWLGQRDDLLQCSKLEVLHLVGEGLRAGDRVGRERHADRAEGMRRGSAYQTGPGGGPRHDHGYGGGASVARAGCCDSSTVPSRPQRPVPRQHVNAGGQVRQVKQPKRIQVVNDDVERSVRDAVEPAPAGRVLVGYAGTPTEPTDARPLPVRTSAVSPVPSAAPSAVSMTLPWRRYLDLRLDSRRRSRRQLPRHAGRPAWHRAWPGRRAVR